MKSLYLILAATAAIATCAPHPKSNDVIWYPVDNEEGVFISLYGEKHRTPQNSKWRSHRRARFSGYEPSWSFDPTENQDPSFFHNINQRRPVIPTPPAPNVPYYLQNQESLFNRPRETPQSQRNQNNNFREILNEVFGDNKYAPVNEYPGGRPGINNDWSNGLPPKNQWGGNSGFENNNQWNKPQTWGSTSGFPTNGLPWQQPVPSNQWGATTTIRPSESEWITQSNTNRPINRPTGSTSNRPTNQSDKLVFPDEDTTSTTVSLNLIPMDPTTRSPCEVSCPVTPEFNPVCGSDGSTYTNAGRLKCAKSCGKDVILSHYGSCGRPPFITPLVSKNSRRRKQPPIFSQFW